MGGKGTDAFDPAASNDTRISETGYTEKRNTLYAEYKAILTPEVGIYLIKC